VLCCIGYKINLQDGYSGQHTLRNTLPRMLVFDVHKAQKTPAVKDLMHRFNTLPVIVPAGCTSLVQPLDVCINKPLKDRIRALADLHYVDYILEWSAQKYNTRFLAVRRYLADRSLSRLPPGSLKLHSTLAQN